MARKGKYTEEQIAGFRAKDTALTDRADAILDNPNSPEMAAFTAAAQRLADDILRYSLRNQILLHVQAADRGIPLSEVKTARAWRELGRPVREDQKFCGLRIVAVKGTETGEDTDENGNPRRKLFRMISVFDKSQTAPV